MKHLCFFSSATSHVLREASSWHWRRGAQKILHICLITRDLLKTSLSANHLTLVPWAKLNMMVIVHPSHPTLSPLFGFSWQEHSSIQWKSLWVFFSPDLVCKVGKRRNHFPYFFVGLFSYVSLLTEARSWRSVNSWLQPPLRPTPTSPSHVPYFFECWEGTGCTAGYILGLGVTHQSSSKLAMHVWKLLYGNLESLESPENNDASTI